MMGLFTFVGAVVVGGLAAIGFYHWFVHRPIGVVRLERPLQPTPVEPVATPPAPRARSSRRKT